VAIEQPLNSDLTSAEDIYTSVVSTWKDLNIGIQKLVGLTADGLQTKMYVLHAQDMISIHCLAHRLELSVKDTVKNVQNKLYYKAMTLLIGSLSAHGLVNERRLFPTRVGGTRWVSHTLHAINICFRSFRPILMQLDDASH
jgi:hypothetical protein